MAQRGIVAHYSFLNTSRFTFTLSFGLGLVVNFNSLQSMSSNAAKGGGKKKGSQKAGLSATAAAAEKKVGRVHRPTPYVTAMVVIRVHQAKSPHQLRRSCLL